MNADDGGVFEASRRFHAAAPASNQPALSPTRGSGLGAELDMFIGPGIPACVADDEVEVAHAAASTFILSDADMIDAALDRMRERRTRRRSRSPGR